MECVPAAVLPCASASAMVFCFAMLRPIQAPLCAAARMNNPFASGEPTIAETAIAPADSPSMVTLRGSPPKAAMFFCTQCRAASMSVMA